MVRWERTNKGGTRGMRAPPSQGVLLSRTKSRFCAWSVAFPVSAIVESKNLAREALKIINIQTPTVTRHTGRRENQALTFTCHTAHWNVDHPTSTHTHLSFIPRDGVQRVGTVVARAFREPHQVVVVVENDVVVPHHVRPQHAPQGLRQVDPGTGGGGGGTGVWTVSIQRQEENKQARGDQHQHRVQDSALSKKTCRYEF